MIIALTDRSVVSVTGPDAARLLQDVITCDVEGLDSTKAVPGALLTPQGKVMFDFILSRRSDADGASAGFFIDLDRSHADDFIRRMTLYRLRAKVAFAVVEPMRVFAVLNETPHAGALVDSRFRGDGTVYRLYIDDASGIEFETDTAPYTAARIAHGVVESGHDFALGDAFPHDLLMDKNGGIAFRKGCFVGQEVVSRMQHRGTARRRVVQVDAASTLPAALDAVAVEAGGKPAGTLGTVAGRQALAIVRTDRIANAMAQNEPIRVGGIAVSLSLPRWTELAFSPGDDDPTP
jgi:tRNA-modifying protein YgfZ